MQDTKQNSSIKLPDRLVTSVDLSRVARELKQLDDWLTQANLRSGGQPVNAPKTSATLEELASINNVSLLEKAHREQLINVLSAFIEHAPKIHMSFAVEPSANFLNKMIVWLRKNVNPVVLLEVGLQPTITAGCSVRTTNKVFDMSLRNRFVDSRPMLVKSIAKFEDKNLEKTNADEIVAQQQTPSQDQQTQNVNTTSPPTDDKQKVTEATQQSDTDSIKQPTQNSSSEKSQKEDLNPDDKSSPQPNSQSQNQGANQ